MHRMRYRKLLRFVHTDICRCFFCWANIIDYGQSDHKLIVSNVRLSAVIALKIETVSNQQKLHTIWTGLDLMIFVERRCVQTRATTCKCYYAQEQFCDAHMPFNEKYPITLPSKHRIAYLIARRSKINNQSDTRCMSLAPPLIGAEANRYFPLARIVLTNDAGFKNSAHHTAMHHWLKVLKSCFWLIFYGRHLLRNSRMKNKVRWMLGNILIRKSLSHILILIEVISK